MSQGQKAAAALIGGYIVYTIARGNLPVWLEILGMRGASPAPVLRG